MYGSEEEKWKHNPILHPSAGCAIRTISKSCTTRGKHPFPLFAAFEKHYYQVSHIINYIHI